MSEFDDLMASLERIPYSKWMHSEGIPVVQGYGVEDVDDLEPIDAFARQSLFPTVPSGLTSFSAPCHRATDFPPCSRTTKLDKYRHN